jgi:heme exporter protein B
MTTKRSLFSDTARVAIAIFRKDLQNELRTKEIVSSMFVFAVLVLLIFNFTLALDEQLALTLGPGILWVSFVFAGTLGLHRSFAIERENRCLSGLMLAPVDRGAIYLGKLASNLVFMVAMEAFVIPLFVILFNLDIWTLLSARDLALFALVLVLGTLGYMAVGTILAAIAANTTMREVLLPVLLFPIAVPVVVGAAEATRLIFEADLVFSPWSWIRVLAVFAVTFLTVSWLTFEYVLEE